MSGPYVVGYDGSEAAEPALARAIVRRLSSANACNTASTQLM